GAVNEVTVWRDGMAHVPPHLSKEQDIPLAPGDRVHVRTPGGGGYGPASARDRALVTEDVRLGYYSAAEAEALFGLPGGVGDQFSAD
ncbi:MAG: hydantoinase B/oxoprolinase family protein, partial [Paracoccaceae bacterium]|nr:hydantoinase B/oxoprolinase family protein [Paracoccaceae bacterium]